MSTEIACSQGKQSREGGARPPLAVVTGASRGIGRATAKALAREGYTVLATARTAEALAKLQAETGCAYLAGDIGREDFVQELFAYAAALGPLQVLVNNAAISEIGLLQDLSLDAWNRLMQTNVTALFLTCRAAIPLFLAEGGGAIVNVSSVWGNVGASCEVAYSASKGAVNSFTKALARELAPSRVRVNAAAFGTIDTEMNAFLTPDERTALADEIGMGRFGTAEEAAELIVGLAVRHPYLTGQIVTMDGGWW